MAKASNARAMTVREVADYFNVNEKTVYRWKTGNTDGAKSPRRKDSIALQGEDPRKARDSRPDLGVRAKRRT